MKKILLMTDYYYPYPSANGICINELARGLKKIGYEVHVLSYKRQMDNTLDVHEGVYVHHVKPRFFFKLKEFILRNVKQEKQSVALKMLYMLQKIKKIMFFPWYPMTSPVFMFRYYRCALKICNEYGINKVVGQYVPFEAVTAAAMIKMKNRKIKSILYVVDTFTNNYNAKKYPILEELGWKWEKRLYSKVDKVFNMQFHKRHHKQERYDLYREKMDYLDIPFLNPVSIPEVSKSNPGVKRIVYAGSLNINDRNPERLCEILHELNREKKCVEIHFYGTYYHELLKQSYSNSTAFFHGSISRSEVRREMAKADYLLNFSGEGMVPSKLFDYISTGRSILHLRSHENDGAIEYLMKYGNSNIVDYQAKSLTNDIRKILAKEAVILKYEKVVDMFEENTPHYSAVKIDEV